MGGVEVKNKIGGLDELRGIAAIMVVIYHLYQSYFRGIPNYNQEGVLVFPQTFNPAFNVLNELSCGVNLFFVLSGFLIHMLYSRTFFDAAISKLFVSKRLARIVPPYYVSMIIALCGGILIQYFKPDFWNVLAHFFFIHNFNHEYAFGIQAVYWSIAVEVQFYLIYCLFRFITDRFAVRHMLTWFFIFSLAVSLAYKYYLYLQADGHSLNNAGLRWMLLYNTVLRLPEWLLGALFFEYLPQIKKIRFKMVWVAALLALTMYLNHWFVWHVFGSDLVYSAAFCLLVVSLTDIKQPIALFSFLGTISYTLYLNHFLIYSVWDAVWMKILHLPKVASVERAFIMGSGFFICIGVSYLLYLCVEKPAMKLKSVWIDRTSTVPGK